jgi:serine protease DegQ
MEHHVGEEARARGPWALALAATALIIVSGCGASDRTGSTTTPAAPASPAAVAQTAADIPGLVRHVEPSVVTVLTDSGLGSGVVYKADGTIVTDAHVVAGARRVTIAFADGQRVAANVRATDEVSDLAVVQANRTGLAPATFQKTLPQVGELAVAIGSPLGFETTVTVGVISGLHRQIPGPDSASLVNLIQTDAPISPGNSGGALINGQGQVVGLTEAYIPPSAGAVSLGFATSAATVVDVADQLLATGTARHAYIGIQPGTITPEIAEKLGIDHTSGAVVLAVATPSPAADAGIQPGDLIIAYNGQHTPAAEDLTAALHGSKPGDQVKLTVVRANATREVSLTIAERPART